jgi:PAS domain S-box-containing protein
MSEILWSTSDIPFEDSILEAGASLESILCTEELQRRPSRPPDYEKENRALVRLRSALADSPSTIFQTLADTILDITKCDSAGLSLLTVDGKKPDPRGKRFYWPAIAGMWNPHVGGGTPRHFGPCGDVLDHNRTLLFRHFERRYPYLLSVIPAAEECLLVPFYVGGKAVGTIWAIMHSDRRKFDAEDDRVMGSLGKFASSAYQALAYIDDLKIQILEREKAEAEAYELARGLEAKIRRLVEANVVGIVLWNIEGAITGANEAFLHMVQYASEDIAAGRVRWTDLTPAEWCASDKRALADLKAFGMFQPFEKEYFRKDGSRVPVLLGGTLFERGGNEGVAFVLDLTEQKRRQQAEENRLQAERQYRTVVDAARDAVITIDATSKIRLVNPAVTKIFGYEPSELIGQPLTVLMPERLASRHLAGLLQYVETGHRRLNWSAIELIGLRKNGEEFPVEISFAEVINDGQRTFTGFIRDITERKQAEELRAARSRQVAVRADVSSALATDNTLRGILQSCAEAVVKHLRAAFARIWVITKDGRFLELHASAGMYTHLDGAHRLVPVGHLNIGLIALERTPHVTNDLINNPRLSNPDWARVEGMVAFAGFPLLAGGQVVGVLAMFSREPISQAVTESLAMISDTIAQGIQRKQAEEEVRRSETFLAEAQALSQTGSWGWNIATGDLFWSRETYRIFGFEPDVNPTLSMTAEAIHPDDRARFENDTETLARDHTDFDRDYRLKLRDGSIKHVHVVGRFAARVFPDLDFIGSIMDVTERKQAADALLKTQAELAEVTRRTTMGELAASIAHEINQPLATVVTNAQACARLLRAEPPPWGDVESAVSDIAEAGKRASDVIARIRLLLRKGVSEPVELSVNDVIRDVIVLTRETTRQKRVMIDTRLTHDVPRVLADRVQLQQVLINLIANAADAMSDIIDRPRTLTIRSKCNDELQVEVAVVDAGVGIDPKYRDRIFEPFFTTKADGMGMGLAICRGIVEACGGRLWATSNPDFGTTVRFALPAAATEGV